MNPDSFIGVVLEGKYSLDRKIGEGGMGAVYLGVQLMVDRPVAIKLLHAGFNQHERVKKRFEVEARAIGRLSHPNVITLYDFGFSQEIDAFYMVMEFLDGDPMHKRVTHGVSAHDAIRISKQIAAALDHAHHLKILHRDLKPENIIIVPMTDGSELVKVLDFGIARIFKDDDDVTKSQAERNRITRAGEVFGTPAYISPEQARGERDLSPSSDLYSLGIMLYEMLEGRLPFWGETAIDTIMLHITAPIPVITRIDVPEGLKQLTYSLLAKEPLQRPQSGRELIAALDAVAASVPGDAPSDWDPLPTSMDSSRPGLADEVTGPMFSSPTIPTLPVTHPSAASASITNKLPMAFEQPLPVPADAALNTVMRSDLAAPEASDSERRTLALIALTCATIVCALVLGVVALVGDETDEAEVAERVRVTTDEVDPIESGVKPEVEPRVEPRVEPEPEPEPEPEADLNPRTDPKKDEADLKPKAKTVKASTRPRKKAKKTPVKMTTPDKTTTEKPKKKSKPDKPTRVDSIVKEKPKRVSFEP